MAHDPELLRALIGTMASVPEEVAVYAIRERLLLEVERDALDLARRFGGLHGLGEMRFELRREPTRTAVRLQEGLFASVFHASGAVALDAGLGPMEAIIAPDAERVDERALRQQSDEALERLRVRPPTGLEDLRFERLWRLKASGVTRDGQRGPTALTRVVGAYRRHIGDLPVLGRASAFIEIAAEGRPAAVGVDWRPVVAEPLDTARVLAPEEGAIRVLNELQRFDPMRRLTLEDYRPECFELGYFSLPKRRHQAVMQPTYVARLRSTGPIPSVGRLIVVPAAPNAYEPIARPLGVPPAIERAQPMQRELSRP